jgi:20S proteasome alpha/beta subunit
LSEKELFSIFINFYSQAVAGLLADARQLLTVARDEAKQYKYDYGVSIPVKV